MTNLHFIDLELVVGFAFVHVGLHKFFDIHALVFQLLLEIFGRFLVLLGALANNVDNLLLCEALLSLLVFELSDVLR